MVVTLVCRLRAGLFDRDRVEIAMLNYEFKSRIFPQATKKTAPLIYISKNQHRYSYPRFFGQAARRRSRKPKIASSNLARTFCRNVQTSNSPVGATASIGNYEFLDRGSIPRRGNTVFFWWRRHGLSRATSSCLLKAANAASTYGRWGT